MAMAGDEKWAGILMAETRNPNLEDQPLVAGVNRSPGKNQLAYAPGLGNILRINRASAIITAILEDLNIHFLEGAGAGVIVIGRKRNSSGFWPIHRRVSFDLHQ